MAYILAMHPGNRLRELRKTAGMSQEDLAKEAGVSQSAISQMENGRADLGLEWMRRFARILNCNVADLLDKRDNPGRLSAEEFELVTRMRAADQQDREAFIRVSEALLRYEAEPAIPALPSSKARKNRAA